MKKINIISVLVLLLFTGCEDFLDSTMKSDYSSGNFFTSQESAEKAVTGLYNSLYDMKWWVFGDAASDDAVKGGNPGDQADITPIDDFTATADNGILSEFWQNTYETISQANNVITFVSPMDFDGTVKGRLVAEAKFIRAFSYFWLVNVFGEVPYKDQPQLTSEAIHVGLSSVDVIYGKIEQDLKDAIPALPPSYTDAKGRVTQGAAYAMLAKVYLYRGDYSSCLTQIGLLEALDVYELERNYADLFKTGGEDSKEVIFGLRFANDEIASLGNSYNVWMAPSHEGGYYFNAPTQSYVDCFTEQTKDGGTDPRLDASIGRDGQPWFNGETFLASWSEATGYLVKKYNEDKVEDQAKSQSTIPYHYLRYADVLLMKAEAINEGAIGDDPIADAAAELDEVRDRAGLAPTTAATQAELREAIRTERRRELGFEFHRFFDLMRWGRETAETALGEDFKGKWTSTRFYYPIPQTERDANQAL